jgi:hypothetical protein
VRERQVALTVHLKSLFVIPPDTTSKLLAASAASGARTVSTMAHSDDSTSDGSKETSCALGDISSSPPKKQNKNGGRGGIITSEPVPPLLEVKFRCCNEDKEDCGARTLSTSNLGSIIGSRVDCAEKEQLREGRDAATSSWQGWCWARSVRFSDKREKPREGRRGACQNPEEEVGRSGNALHILLGVMRV